MSNLFGLSYPPGAANDPNAPWNQSEGSCEVCGKPFDDCICPECPECGAQGDPVCYEKHGLILTDEQKDSKERADREAQEADERQCAEEMRLEPSGLSEKAMKAIEEMNGGPIDGDVKVILCAPGDIQEGKNGELL